MCVYTIYISYHNVYNTHHEPITKKKTKHKTTKQFNYFSPFIHLFSVLSYY